MGAMFSSELDLGEVLAEGISLIGIPTLDVTSVGNTDSVSAAVSMKSWTCSKGMEASLFVAVNFSE